MMTVSEFGVALALDVLTRISLVLAVGLLLACTVRRDAALRHAILVSGLAATLIMPAAMLTVQVLPVSRWPLGLLGLSAVDNLAEVAVVSSRAPSELVRHPGSVDHPSFEIVPRGKEQSRRGRWEVASARSDESHRGVLARRSLNLSHGRLITYGLLWVWLLGAIVKGIGLGFSLLRLRRIVERARPVTGDQVHSILRLIERRIPMQRMPRLLETADVSGPVAAGLIGNYILLPFGWAAGLRRGEMLAVLCHESAHLARHDHRVVILQELLASALWFHPVMHLFNRMLNRVREEVCDNYAIAEVDRALYCEALLRLAVGRRDASLPGATSMWAGRWSLEDRVRGILDEERATRTSISRVTRSAAVTISLAFCGLIAMPQVTASRPNVRVATSDDGTFPPRPMVGAVSNQMTRIMNRSFAVNGEKLLRVENLAGRVELVPGTGLTVEVEAIVRVSELAEADAQRLIDDIRWIEVPAEDGGSRWGLVLPEGRYPTVHYPVSGESPTGITTVSHLLREVRLSDRPGALIPAVEFDLRVVIPPQARVAIHNAVGPVEGADLAAPLQATTYAGSIQLRDVRAPLTVSSEVGPIMITNLQSDASVRTGSGGIELTRVTGGHVDLATGSGGCRIVQPPDAAFTLRYLGAKRVVVLADGVTRSSSGSGVQRTELLFRGLGGPVITVDAGTGDCVIESSL